MKILIVSAAFFPENSPRSFRATELAREFARCGHFVTVLTKNRGADTEQFCRDHQIAVKYFPSPSLPTIRISQGGVLNFLTRGLNRILLMLLEYPEIEYSWQAMRLVKRERGYQLLISIAVPYPIHWGIAWAWRQGIADCWVADCGDPYMGNSSDSYRKPFYFKYVEKWMFSKTDFISIPIDEARTAYYPEFRNKLRVIPQGLRFEDYEFIRKPRETNAVPTFAYAGSFIPGKRDPTLFIQFLLELDLNFIFEIYTPTPGIVAEFEQQSRGRVKVFGIIPRRQLISRLSQMDFLVFIRNSTKTQMPSKLIDYYLAGKPVLEIATEFTNSSEVLSFLKGDYTSRIELTNFDRFRIELVAGQFIGLYHEMKSKN